mmetsp:Transcript_20327/g.60719  ORF Transcript_20327/g.60719 Transcript_20327/m.60719 type:complete len:306 (-) Transcript_20327:64-981(-)
MSSGVSFMSSRTVPMPVSWGEAWLWLCPCDSSVHSGSPQPESWLWALSWPPWPCASPCSCEASSHAGSSQSDAWEWPFASSCPWPPWPCSSSSASRSPRPPLEPSSVRSFVASKASMAMSSPIGTESGFFDRLHLTMGTVGLIERIWASVWSILAASHASTLLRSTLSANATCWAGSLTASLERSRVSCVMKCTVSTTVRMPSILHVAFTTGSSAKVWQMGPGSATPVVSMRIPSIIASGTPRAIRSSTVSTMLRIAVTRSSRSVQQRQPLSKTVMDSMVFCLPTALSTSISSMAVSPNSFSITA